MLPPSPNDPLRAPGSRPRIDRQTRSADRRLEFRELLGGASSGNAGVVRTGGRRERPSAIRTGSVTEDSRRKVTVQPALGGVGSVGPASGCASLTGESTGSISRARPASGRHRVYFIAQTLRGEGRTV